jgi:hypothetical protein
VPVEGGEPRNLSKGFDEHFVAESPAGFAWAPDGKTIYAIAQNKVRQHLVALSVETGEVRPVSTGDRVLHRFSLSKDGNRVACTAEAVMHPAEVFVSPVKDYSPERLTKTNPHLRGVTLGATEVVHWKSKDGLEVEGLLVKPVGYRNGTRYPLLTYVHGGPALNFRLGFTPYGTSPQAQRYPIQVFAGQGYAVFCPNPRGSGGYGEKFRRSNFQDWGGRDFEDVLTGIDMLIERGIADRDRLGLMGWSYRRHRPVQHVRPDRHPLLHGGVFRRPALESEGSLRPQHVHPLRGEHQDADTDPARRKGRARAAGPKPGIVRRAEAARCAGRIRGVPAAGARGGRAAVAGGRIPAQRGMVRPLAEKDVEAGPIISIVSAVSPSGGVEAAEGDTSRVGQAGILKGASLVG